MAGPGGRQPRGQRGLRPLTFQYLRMGDALMGLGWGVLPRDCSKEAWLPAQAGPPFQEGERVGESFSMAANCWVSVLTRQGPLWTLRFVVTSQITSFLS